MIKTNFRMWWQDSETFPSVWPRRPCPCQMTPAKRVFPPDSPCQSTRSDFRPVPTLSTPWSEACRPCLVLPPVLDSTTLIWIPRPVTLLDCSKPTYPPTHTPKKTPFHFLLCFLFGKSSGLFNWHSRIPRINQRERLYTIYP